MLKLEQNKERLLVLSKEQKLRIYDLFSDYCSENKRKLFDTVVQERTNHLTVMLENVYQPQNASAVLRSCECFGVQNVHVVESEHYYDVNPDIALGASKWTDIHRYRQTIDAYKYLRDAGYRIVATMPHKDDTMLEDLDITQKTALIFGTEKDGLSDIAVEAADSYVKIPMYGFTESLNISVSAGICLQAITAKMRKSDIAWQLSEIEQIDTKIAWLCKAVRSADEVLERILEELGMA